MDDITWITTPTGKKIPIQDDGPKKPAGKVKKVKDEQRASAENADKDLKLKKKKRNQIDKDADEKEAQIQRNKKEAEERKW